MDVLSAFNRIRLILMAVALIAYLGEQWFLLAVKDAINPVCNVQG